MGRTESQDRFHGTDIMRNFPNLNLRPSDVVPSNGTDGQAVRQQNLEKFPLPRTDRETIMLFRHLNPDPPMEAALSRLGLEAHRFSIDLGVGKGYDIMADRTAMSKVIDLGSYKLSPVGVCLPENVTAKEYEKDVYICRMADSTAELQRKRLVDLGVTLDVLLAANPSIGHRRGYNIVSNDKRQWVSSVYEKRLIMIECVPDAPWKEEFSRVVNGLPKEYDCHDRSNRQDWSLFFYRFGTHYIRRAYIGGSIAFHICKPSSEEDISTFAEQHDALNAMINTAFEASVGSDTSFNSRISNHGCLSVNVHAATGGFLCDFMLCKTENEFRKVLKRWEEALWEHPIVSDTSIELGDLTNLVCEKDMEVGIAMRYALKDYCRGEL